MLNDVNDFYNDMYFFLAGGDRIGDIETFKRMDLFDFMDFLLKKEELVKRQNEKLEKKNG